MTEREENNWELEWEFLVAEAWIDEGLMERLLARPGDLLTERGFPLPEGASLEVVREEVVRIRITAPDGTLTTLVLPPRPDDAELAESDLEVLASGKGPVWIGGGACGGVVSVGWGGACGWRCGVACGVRCGVACGVRCAVRCGACACRCRC